MQREAKVSSFPPESLSTQQGSVEDRGSRALQEAAELSTTCDSAAQVGPKKSFFPLQRKWQEQEFLQIAGNRVTKYRGWGAKIKSLC